MKQSQLNPDQAIYVAKGTQVVGPLSAEQLENLRKTQELQNYDWIWNPESRSWDPIPHQAPPPDEPSTQVAQSLEAFAAAVKSSATVAALAGPPTARPDLLGICYDPRNVLSGTIASHHAAGCIFKSAEQTTELAPFRMGSILHLNLLDPRTKKSETIPVHLANCLRRDDGFELTLEWKAVPNLVLAPPSG